MSELGNRRPRNSSVMQALVTSATPFVPGFRVEKLVGEGGFGQVWRGVRESDGVVVAIKILHLELIRSVDALTRFERELAAIEQLDHRSVVRAFGHGTLSDGRPFLVLEFIDGPSLRDVITERGSLPPAEVLAILTPLCDALQLAHDEGLVHRDVKASNVILGFDSGGARPVLLDFGLVKLTDQDGPGLTSSRSMLGTPAAMAPEQLKGQPVTARTDIYALGLLAFHMLTGKPAFGAAPGVVQTYLQIHGPRPRPSTKADLDPAIDEPIGRALHPDPSKRYTTAREFLEALRAVISPVADAGGEQDVVALYVEGDPAALAGAAHLASAVAMTIAMQTTDSILAVATKADVAALQPELAKLAAGGAKVAVGATRATIVGSVIDGPALDVEGWAPYPLTDGVWIAPALC